MSTAQWLFEYLALREKEREDFELVQLFFKTFRKMLISVLGLNLLNKEDDESNTEDNEYESFIPLSLMTGRREIIETILKRFEDEVDAGFQEDEDFERVSAAMAKGEDLGDMAPMFEVDDDINNKLNTWFTPGKVHELQKLGVKVTDSPRKPAVHIDTDIEEINRKRTEQQRISKQTNEELIDQMKEEARHLKSRGVLVTFDEDDND